MEWYDQINETFVRNVAIGYFQEIDFTPFRIFPAITTVHSSGMLGSYNKEDWLRIGDKNDYKRVGATESVGDDYSVGSQPYMVEEVAFHKDITKKEANEYDNPFDPVSDGTKFVINRLNLIATANFVDTFLKTGVWANEYVGGTDFTKWSDASSTPVEDVLTYQDEVRAFTGFAPNKMIMTPDVYKALRGNTEVKSLLKITDTKIVTKNLLRQLFDMEELEVLGTVRTTAKKGQTATKSNTGYFAAGKVFLGYVPKAPSKYEPSAGYHMVQTIGGDKVVTEAIPMKHLNHALRVEGTINLTPKVVASDLGCLLTSVV